MSNHFTMAGLKRLVEVIVCFDDVEGVALKAFSEDLRLLSASTGAGALSKNERLTTGGRNPWTSR